MEYILIVTTFVLAVLFIIIICWFKKGMSEKKRKIAGDGEELVRMLTVNKHVLQQKQQELLNLFNPVSNKFDFEGLGSSSAAIAKEISKQKGTERINRGNYNGFLKEKNKFVKRSVVICSVTLSACLIFLLISIIYCNVVAMDTVRKAGVKYRKNTDNEYIVEDVAKSPKGEIVIPSEIRGCKVTSIGDWAFSGCSSLTSVTIPDSVTSIGSSAFYNCSSLTSITIPDSVTSIGSSAFYNCSSLTSITIPDSVTSIGSSAFRYCNSLTSVTIPNSVTRIGDWAFSSCSSLTSVTIPDSVTSIGSSAFSGCSSLTSVTIPDSVTSIGSSAFRYCNSLTSVTIPDSVMSIGSSAFSGCSSLEEIIIPFVGAVAGKTASDTDQYPFGYIFGTSGYTGGTAVTQYYYGSSTSLITSTTFYIPSSLRKVTVTGGNILYGAFEDCSSLTSVTIGNSVTSIGDHAFYNCSSLTSITIPDSVTSIGYGAFRYCSSLTSVTIGNSVTSIGNFAFEDCSSLTSVTIPNSVTSINYGVFEDCSSLTSVTIPNSVTSIDDYAFKDCSGLKEIHFKGTKAQWQAISKGDKWKTNVPSSCKVYCVDGTLNI